MKNQSSLKAGSTFRLTRNFAIFAGSVIFVIALVVFYAQHSLARNWILDATIIGVALISVFIILLIMVWRAEKQIQTQHLEIIKTTQGILRADAANQEKTQFLANISHELRTPLNAIIGFSEIIKNEIRGPLGNTAYKEYIVDIHRSGQHLLNVINEVLSMVKAESGAMVIETKPVDLVSLINTVIRMMRQEAEKSGVAISIEAEANLQKISTDGSKLNHVLINLLSNAIKFTPAGGRVRITVVQDPSILETRILVSDTGIGMRIEDIPLAMSPFGQIENVFTKVKEGSGLGLSLCQKFVTLLGGKLEIESVPDQGTTVTVTLPNHLGEEGQKEDDGSESNDSDDIISVA